MATDLSIPPNNDFGYDPGFQEAVEVLDPDVPAQLPAAALVDATYLPPVGRQTTSDCTAWASTYGLATFTAARAGNYAPTTAALQASPSYIYIQVLEQEGKTSTCTGSPFTPYFKILDGGGTATVEQAPAAKCPALWTDYGGKTLPPDAAFNVGTVRAFGNAGNLLGIKTVLALGGVLAFATELYTDFTAYRGTPIPYVGNGIYLPHEGPTDRHAAHCMLIVGYDDDIAAFKIQNSWGTGWGSSGFVWMAYETFMALAVTVMYVVPPAT